MAALKKVQQFLKGDSSVPAESLKGKVVGLYFSAHWCPPCRGFTPQLAEWYKRFKTTHPRKDEFEIVFVSSDKDEESFKEYFAEMPWLALPYEDRATKNALSKEFKVRGIPSFVILNAEGKVQTKQGRGLVREDPEGAKFPWNPPTFDEVIGASFIKNDGTEVAVDSLKGKHLGVYFSAHWCPPCRKFTPKLSETYKKLKEAGKEFEVVFVSADRSAGDFKEYFAEQPWLAVPYEDEARKDGLMKYFECQGYPTFIMLDEQRQVVAEDAVGAVSADPEGADYPWAPKPLVELQEGTGAMLNDHAVCIAFTSGEEVEVANTKAMLKPIAEAEEAAAKDSGDEQLFFMYTADADMIDMVRDFANLGDASPLLVILDIPNQAKYIASSPELTADNVKSFVGDFKAGKCEPLSIR